MLRRLNLVPFMSDMFVDMICNSPKNSLNRFNDKEREELRKVISLLIKDFVRKFSSDCNDTNEFYNITEVKELYEQYLQIRGFLDEFTKQIHKIDSLKTKYFFHDSAVSLREFGKALECDRETKGLDNENVFLIAEFINKLIKGIRKIEYHGRIVIDSVKNSLELSFFQARYSAFYCIATNQLADERYDYKVGKSHCNRDHIIELDNMEFKGGDVLKGDFSAPDIENCIQKSDYHLFYTNDFNKYKERLTTKNKDELNLDLQLIKFLALLFQPGIVTPTAIERNMQIAFNAKANSGCISRQVGAVITDKNHSVKTIGWNDVAAGQMPCNLRNVFDLVDGKNEIQYSPFEKGQISLHTYDDKINFKEKVATQIGSVDKIKLNGKNCSFCFKTFHNVFEGKANQVHTRSLHAEENAMLQLTKYGGQGVENGTLYTTASPCELCSKKAFQLGINKIIYIDPYPGIATNHILKSGKKDDLNPKLIMFQGAVGRTYHKLYESFIAYKDELNILVNLHPKMNKERIINKLTSDKNKQDAIKDILGNF